MSFQVINGNCIPEDQRHEVSLDFKNRGNDSKVRDEHEPDPNRKGVNSAL